MESFLFRCSWPDNWFQARRVRAKRKPIFPSPPALIAVAAFGSLLFSVSYFRRLAVGQSLSFHEKNPTKFKAETSWQTVAYDQLWLSDSFPVIRSGACLSWVAVGNG